MEDHTVTTDERKRIERLRKNGNSFSRIAEITGLSKDSVRMYCTRNSITPGKDKDSCCRQCGKELDENQGKGRKACFCSSKCRVTYWRDLKAREKDRNYTRICAHCGSEFFSVRRDRKYCSHDCYIKARFGEKHEA